MRHVLSALVVIGILGGLAWMAWNVRPDFALVFGIVSIPAVSILVAGLAFAEHWGPFYMRSMSAPASFVLATLAGAKAIQIENILSLEFFSWMLFAIVFGVLGLAFALIFLIRTSARPR